MCIRLAKENFAPPLSSVSSPGLSFDSALKCGCIFSLWA